jgi:peptidoglycan hydrolase-like protein with peptidoglycan-binding domain
MSRKISIVLLITFMCAPLTLVADELTQIIQEDLVALGYDTGTTDGELNTQTIVAISKFQAEHDLEITGEVTPQLAGVIKAAMSNKNGATTQTAPAAAAQPSAEQDAAALQLAQQNCLEEKYAAAQESKKKKRGFGRLLRAVARTSFQLGNGGLGRTASDIYSVNATADDLTGAAEDLGLTEDDLEECRNPG